MKKLGIDPSAMSDNTKATSDTFDTSDTSQALPPPSQPSVAQ
jgi:hypothetical protein